MIIYTEYQEFKNFNTKQKLNSQQASWYLPMSEFIHPIYYRPRSKISKQDPASRHSEDKKSAMDGHLFDEGQLLDLVNDVIGKEDNVEDVELEGINVATR